MRLKALLSVVFVSLASLTTVQGCSSEVARDEGASEQHVSLRTDYEISFPEYNAIYRTNFTNADDAFKVNVKIGETTIPAATHLFGETVNVVPYSNRQDVRTADGTILKHGDEIIAQLYKPGEIGITIKHHRSEFPTLDLNPIPGQETMDEGQLRRMKAAMKEHFKLQDTHVGIVVGVKRDGVNGAITLNNPQDYEGGLFGDEKYAMIFLKPVYPSYLSAGQIKAFEDNIRTLLVGFNAVTDFPDDYDGGDPLGARDPEKVREYVKQMIFAINGQHEARAWFKDPKNQVYCAELAFLAFSAGLITPLNDATMVPLVGQNAWNDFKKNIERHNKRVRKAERGESYEGQETSFTDLNYNKLVKYVRLTVAPDDLKPAAAYGPVGEDKKLALEPLTMSDIVDEFLRTHIPREKISEKLAPLQAKALENMKSGLLEQMGMDKLDKENPNRKAVEAVYDEIVEAVGTSYEDYTAFRAAIEPLLQKARAITGPRGDTGEGLFVPPSLFHVAAQGKRAGLFKFQYEGHGVHASAVKLRSSPAAEPTPVSRIASDISCYGQCGGQAVGGCYCDARCATNPEGCCSDVADVCR